MQRIRNRYILIILLFSSFAIIPASFGFKKSIIGSKNNIYESLPYNIEKWHGNRLYVEEKVYKILETDIVIVNRYIDGKDYVNLSIVYYPDIKVEFHRPEACNAGTGDSIIDMGSRDIIIKHKGENIVLTVNAFSAIRTNGTKDLYYYIFNSDGYYGNSYLKLRMKMAKDYILTKNANGSMIVFSTPVISDLDASDKVLTKFISDIYPYLCKST